MLTYPQPRILRKLSLFLVLLTGLCSFNAFSQTSTAEGAREINPAIERISLKNGLTLLVAPQSAMPSFTVTIHYRVGTAREWQGLYGTTELIATMLMDGTSQLGSRDPRQVARLLARLDALDSELQVHEQRLRMGRTDEAEALARDAAMGVETRAALMNELQALSIPEMVTLFYQDRGATRPLIEVSETAVQITLTLPSNQLSYFLALEATRLSEFASRNFYHNRETLQTSRRSEQLLPSFQLLQGMAAEAFHVHPFGHYLADADSIAGITREELEYYRRLYFQPSRVVIALAGGVDPGTVRRLAAKYLGSLKSVPSNPALLEPAEPDQNGERRLEVAGAQHAEVLMAFHRQPADLHAGDPALPVLLELLGDPWSGVLAPLRIDGIASGVTAVEYPASSPLGALYPSLIVVGATAAGNVSPDVLEMAMKERLARLVEAGPSQEALEGAIRRTRLNLAAILTQPDRLAPALARSYATLESESALLELYQRLADVDQERIRQISRNLFISNNRTVARMTSHPGDHETAARQDRDGEGAQHEAGR